MLAHRPGAFERAQWVLTDRDTACAQQVDVEPRMVAVLDELEFTDLVTTRETNKLKPVQAQTIIAAAILRQLYAVVAH